MKKKILLALSFIALLVVVLAFAVSAESRIVKLDYDPGLDCDDSLVSYLDGDYAPYTPNTWASVTGGLDTESRVVLTDGNGGYYVFPAWYIYKDEAFETGRAGNHNGYKHCLKFERINAAIAKLNEDNGTEHFASFTSHSANVVRLEIINGVALIAQDTQKFQNCTLLKEIRFPATISDINASHCFAGSTIEELDLSKTRIEYIKTSFASGAKSLGKVILPSTVTSIQDYAFNDCSLTSINTENVTSYGQYVFAKTTNLETFVIAEGVATIPVNFCQYATGLKTLVFPSTVTTFYGYNFIGCTGLEYVEIKAAPGIGDSAFYGCSALKTLILPNSTASIGNKAFEGCSSLTSVRLPESLTTTGHDMFKNCSKLATVIFPKGMGSIHCQYDFSGCDSLTNVIYTGSTEDTFYTDHLTKYFNGKITIQNHCVAYYDGVHDASGEILKTFLGQEFMSEYKVYTACGRECGAENVIEQLDKLIHARGYSNSEIPGSKAMMHSFVVDKDLIDDYKVHFENLKLGVLAVGENAESPFNGNLIDTQGNKAHEKIAMVDFTEKPYDEIAIKIGGIDGYEDTALYFCGFVIGGESVYYIENETVSTSASTITYTQVSAILNPSEEE
ncbi:MAG: leucine-rich repeat domain-containing protein [Clostridia bacterium]|nr:leucine-rich repeat domain-containing protein [Clostridia bacterium]